MRLRPGWRAAACAVPLWSAIALGGCATTRKFLPSGQEWKRAATRAAMHPGTWVPLAGAGVVAVGGWDHEISDWARREAPVFGSPASADDYSDYLRISSDVGMIISALAVRDSGEAYWPATFRRMVWEHAGVIVASGLTQSVKRLTDRVRPNGEPRSFPSGHSTVAFAHTGMAYRNLEALHIRPVWTYAAASAEAGTAVLTAWARVEAGKHYPTDVLAGAALGNFVALLVHDAFLERYHTVQVGLAPEGDVIITFVQSF